MKKFFLATVAISTLCSSCETADETYLKETNYELLNVKKTKGLDNSDYEIYRNVLEHFPYSNDQNYIENIVRFEKHVNRTLKNDTQANTYESINMDRLAILVENDDIINELNYSAEFKEHLYKIVYKNSVTEFSLRNEKENSLINTLLKMHKDNNGDDLLNGKRTIAFAYGAQYSFKHAVLYAGAIELKTKIN